MNRGLLLDTHVLLWWLSNDIRLSEPIRARIAEEPLVFVSAASVWEASIKAALGRLHLPGSLTDAVRKCEFSSLPVTLEHAEESGRLPLHHRDPFDRMLVAQARQEDLTLVSHDQKIRLYDVGLLEF